MKVQELIDALLVLDPDAEVYKTSWYEPTPDTTGWEEEHAVWNVRPLKNKTTTRVLL